MGLGSQRLAHARSWGIYLTTEDTEDHRDSARKERADERSIENAVVASVVAAITLRRPTCDDHDGAGRPYPKGVLFQSPVSRSAHWDTGGEA